VWKSLDIIAEKLSQPTNISLVIFCSLAFFIAHSYANGRTRKRRVMELLYGKTYKTPEKQGLGKWFMNLISPILPNSASLAATKNMLGRAGIKMSPEEFFAVRIAAGVVVGGLFSLLFIPDFLKMLIFGIAGGYMFFLLPHTIAANKSLAVKKAADRECHNYIDLLRIAVAEGADITHAVEMVSSNYPGVLANVFLDAINKAKGGKPLLEALQDMANWLDTRDVTLLVDSIVQSRSTGTSLASVLEAQSIRMRDVLRAKATEQAQKAPVKMVFPLMICILPALLIIAVGPPLMQLKDIFNF